LEVGCGPVLLSTMPGAAETGFRRWAIAEPAQSYAASARAATAQDARFSVIEGYLEACCDALKELAPDGYEAAIVSSLVHETTNPLELLTAVASLMKSGGKILVSAPNAFSFHRLLAEACGLIRSPHELSAMDRRLGHTTVFDPQSLSELVGRAGFTSLRSDGCLFKPFTNAQMQTIMEAIGPTGGVRSHFPRPPLPPECGGNLLDWGKALGRIEIPLLFTQQGWKRGFRWRTCRRANRARLTPDFLR